MTGRGQVSLSGGSVTVPHRRIPADAMAVVQRITALGTIGELVAPTLVPGVGLTIRSLSPLDNSVVEWVVFT